MLISDKDLDYAPIYENAEMHRFIWIEVERSDLWFSCIDIFVERRARHINLDSRHCALFAV